MSFINFTNHPSEFWDQTQIEESLKYGDIIDLPFPNVDPAATENEVLQLGQEMVEKIVSYKPSCVLAQGEFSLCFYVINQLLKQNIKVVTACSERNTVEKDGLKISKFAFVKYREYRKE